MAGIAAAGVRLTPAERATSIARVDIWADPESGLPLRVELSGAGDPVRCWQSTLRDVSLAEPAQETTLFRPGSGVDIAYEESVDVAAAANAFARTTCRARWPGSTPATARTPARSASTAGARPP